MRRHQGEGDLGLCIDTRRPVLRSQWSQTGEKGDLHWYTCPVRWAEEVELVVVAGGDSWKDELRVCDLSNVQISLVCALFG